MLIDEEIGYSCSCEILNDAEDNNEKYVGTGWFEFVLAKKVTNGDTLEFIYDYATDIMYVLKLNSN